ncbi:MAG: glycosyltransferase family 2 protein [Candidatus Falkowbacteria bacterium]|nr:glycosyltransferase family 2 protein [Candidatus Falkowbacteria bacterium]
MKVTCVIPTYNHAATLAKVVNDLQNVVDQIVVVDDGSNDDTKDVLSDLPVDVLSHLVNRGQGAALRTGTIHALRSGADIIVHFDADGQFRVEDIEKVIEPIRSQIADIVFGSRFLDSTTKMPGFKKKVIMPLARLVNRVFLNIKLSDPQSGFRAFSRRAAEKIDWSQDRMAHCSEILVVAHRSDLPLTEVPITVLYHDFGQRFSGGFKILRDLFLAKMNN